MNSVKLILTKIIHIAMMEPERVGKSREDGAAVIITRETDYALRILRALSRGTQLTAGEIAEQELVPKQFAYKIMKKLSRADLVAITRGVDGGCRLKADLDQVTLYDLMAAMEESRSLSACMEPGYRCPWREAHGGCTIHCRLSQVQNALNYELRAHTLRSLLSGEEEQ